MLNESSVGRSGSGGDLSIAIAGKSDRRPAAPTEDMRASVGAAGRRSIARDEAGPALHVLDKAQFPSVNPLAGNGSAVL
ncbi:hypothetical protein EMIT051CA3_90314 [Pseudomonas chlororaphis]